MATVPIVAMPMAAVPILSFDQSMSHHIEGRQAVGERGRGGLFERRHGFRQTGRRGCKYRPYGDCEYGYSAEDMLYRHLSCPLPSRTRALLSQVRADNALD
jgi:hypothetical protein